MFKKFPLFISFLGLVIALLIGVINGWYSVPEWMKGNSGNYSPYFPLLHFGVPTMALCMMYGYWLGMLIESPVKRWFNFVEEFLTQGQKIIARTVSTVVYLLFPVVFKCLDDYMNLPLEKSSYEYIKKEFFRWNSNDVEGSLLVLLLALPILMFIHWGISRLLVSKK